MNIFYVDTSPTKCAEYMVDKHVTKMVLETCQLLSTAHRVLDGELTTRISKKGRKLKHWKLNDERETKLMLATHVNHPSAVWCRQSSENYKWLYDHFVALLNEYTYRYEKVHKCFEHINTLKTLPCNISYSNFTQVTPAMNDQYIISKDSVENYRNYYRTNKKHLHKWKGRNMPNWIENQC